MATPHVLIVEPDRLLANTYAETFRSAGYKSTIATTAQAAIHAADATKPDLVVLELQLVSHSGIEFLYEFRSYPDWQDIPVIVLTNVPPVEFSATGTLLQRELGVVHYFYKPRTTLAELLQIATEQLAVQTVVKTGK